MAADVAIDEAAALERTVAVLPVAAVKGLEFDSVVVVEPAAIAGASARGANDLYVALTRTTGRLGVVHARALPEWMHGLRLVDGIAAIDA
jgi:DNA helicase IV